MIDCGQVSELSKEEKEDAMKALSTELVFISHTGDCKVRVERRLWVINRRRAMLQEAPPMLLSGANYTIDIILTVGV